MRLPRRWGQVSTCFSCLQANRLVKGITGRQHPIGADGNSPNKGGFVPPLLIADSHPMMSRMHKPVPRLLADQHDKRSVISIEMHDIDQWPAGTQKEASELLRFAPVIVFDAAPA